MRTSIGSAGRRLLKGAFRVVGLEVKRYAADPSNQGNHRAPLFGEPNRLSFAASFDAGKVHRSAAFVLIATDHGTLIVNRNDYCVTDHAQGFGVGFQILNTSSFDYEEVRLALTLLGNRLQTYGPGVVAIDCGANIGVHTIEWARQMTGWGSVVAIEAQERLFYSLCGNISINNCMNARAIWAAAGSKSGKMRIPVPDYGKPASFGSLELRKREGTECIGQEIDYREESCIMVDIVTLDDLKLDRLDLLKIDVEGMEADVLVGAQRTINACKPMMIIEVVKSDQDWIQSYLSLRGYRCYLFAGNVLAVHESDSAGAGVSASAGILTVEPVRAPLLDTEIRR